MPQPTLFFQSSMPRAGSTLLQNILGQNPDFFVTPTSGALELIFGARYNYSNCPEFKAQDPELMKKAFLAFCQAGLKNYYTPLTDKPYIVDKSRGWGVHYDLLTQVLGEEPKILCMVRDLRQILASMEKLYRLNNHKAQPIENHAKLQGTTTFKRMVAQLQNPPVGLALDRLIEIHQRGWAPKIHFVRYEDLSTKPAETMQKIYDYLGVKPFNHNFTQVKQVTQEDDVVNGFDGLHVIREKVELTSNDCLEILGRDAVRHIEHHFAWYFQRFGYQPLPQGV